MTAKYILYPLGYALIAAASLVLIPLVLVPLYLQWFPVNALTVTVWSVYFCAPATAAGGAIVGLIMALKKPVPTWRVHLKVLLGLFIFAAAILVVFFPHQ